VYASCPCTIPEQFEKAQAAFLSQAEKEVLKQLRSQMRGVVDFAVTWVIVAVALALGIGTTGGWKRVVLPKLE
jgi:phosphate/sulfate permease